MTKTVGRRAALMMPVGLLPLGLAACGDTKKILPAGDEIPVVAVSGPLEKSLTAPAVSVPASVSLQNWPQTDANPAHATGNLAGPRGLAQAWRANIGQGGGYRQPLQASPVAAEGKVFAMDANGNVTALSAASGGQIWHTNTRPKHATVLNIGGGLGYDGGILYATTGYAELLALDPASGNIKWRQPLDFPARSAPTIAGGIVSLVTQNDLLLTFNAATGTPSWRFIGKVGDSKASVAVSGAPAYSSGILVAGFSSGTLAALDANSGTPIWEKSFASTLGQSSPLDFSDIAAPPVIANDVVYAIGLGRSMQAVDLHSGAKVWEHSAAGNQAICAAGGFVFVLTTDQILAAVHADDGLVSWTLQLPPFKNMKKQKNPIIWAGPIMINGLLVLTNDHGEIAMVDAQQGIITATTTISGPADMAPIAVGGAMLLLTRNATLTAYS
ncbi:MAG: PQQ-binding-like beta-propeller repeat protein [Acidocella sp.]|nr:PQQ-binding-like beta-propeller repeat protein [Acidocella sp.]